MSGFENTLDEILDGIRATAKERVSLEAKRLRDSATWGESEWAEYEQARDITVYEIKDGLDFLWTLLFVEPDEIREDQRPTLERWESYKSEGHKGLTTEDLAPHGVVPKLYDLEKRRRAVELRHEEIERLADTAD